MSSFRLQSGDCEFNTRVDALFSSLQTVAVELKEPQEQGTKRAHEDDDEDDRQKDEDDRGMPPPWRGGRGRGQGSRGRFGPRNSTPDYIKNPHNWTRYNMKDTKVLSDRENKREGLKLFHDLKSRKMEEEQSHDDEDQTSGDKIVFKKPAKPTIVTDTEMVDDSNKPDTTADALFGGSRKIKLDEYEVGKPKSKRKPKKVNNKEKCEAEKQDSAKEIKLNYLMYEEEDNDV